MIHRPEDVLGVGRASEGSDDRRILLIIEILVIVTPQSFDAFSRSYQLILIILLLENLLI